MITPVYAAWISDRLWFLKRDKFHRECAVARELGITLLELIQRRIANRLRLKEPYETYEIQDLAVLAEGNAADATEKSRHMATGPEEVGQTPSQVRRESWGFSAARDANWKAGSSGELDSQMINAGSSPAGGAS